MTDKIINGTYKKDNPNKDIGYQKWEVRKTYTVEMAYKIEAKTKKEAEEILDKEEVVKVEALDGYGKTFRETITGRHVNDLEGDEPTVWTKIEECVPMEDTDMDTDERYLNYEDPYWTKDDFEWRKNGDGTDRDEK